MIRLLFLVVLVTGLTFVLFGVQNNHVHHLIVFGGAGFILSHTLWMWTKKQSKHGLDGGEIVTNIQPKPQTSTQQEAGQTKSVQQTTVTEQPATSSEAIGKLQTFLGENMLAILTVLFGLLAVGSMFWVQASDDLFWPLVWTIFFVCASLVAALAAADKLTWASEKAKENKMVVWAGVTGTIAILIAIYGYEDGYRAWWLYPPFILAVAVILAPFVLPWAGKELGKALTGGHGGFVTALSWGVILMIGSATLFSGSRHKFFEPEVTGFAFDWLKWMATIGFFLIAVITPLLLMMKKK